MTASCIALEKSINACTKLDLDIPKKLSYYAGKIIQLSCTKPDIIIFFEINAEVKVFQSYKKNPDVIIEGPAKDWIKLTTADDLGASLINGELNVIGDTKFLMGLSSLMNDLDIDWGGYVSKFIGDVPAEIVERSAKKLLFWSKKANKSLTRNIDNLLHEETSLLPTMLELNSFYDRLRDLEMNTDRIEAKIKFYKNRL